MVKLCFFVPEVALESVKQAVFDTGAGQIGDYDQCCWQTKGLGQFRPSPGSKPHVGALGVLTTLEEWKVEMVCKETIIDAAVAALKTAHPYETVAYEILKMEASPEK